MPAGTLLTHIVCWSLMALSTGGVYAGVAANGIPLHGEAFPGVSQQAVRTTASVSNPVAQAVPAPPAETPAAGSTSQRE